MNRYDITELAYEISNAYEEANTEYIQLMAQQINYIQKQKDEIINQEKIDKQIKRNILLIGGALTISTRKALKKVDKLYTQITKDEYKSKSIYYDMQEVEQVPLKKNFEVMTQLAKAKTETATGLLNLSQTTYYSTSYITSVNKAIQIVQSGQDNYMSQIKRVITQEASRGIQITYPSGAKRRLDSAVRMNILDGSRGMTQEMRKIMGKQFGYNGVEVDAHGLCAEDHQPVQGRQYSYGVDVPGYKRWESIDTGRPIGEMNCGHMMDYIVLGAGVSPYSNKELQDMEDYSNEIVEVNGRQMTRYQASQYMRQLETNMRYCKDSIIGLRELEGAEADVARKQALLNNYRSVYSSVASSAGLQKDLERAFVPGF